MTIQDATSEEIENAVNETLEEDTETEEVEDSATEEETEAEETAEEADAADEPPAKKPSRGENRFHTLANRVKEEAAHRERLERELQEVKANQQARTNVSYEEQARIREEKLAIMEPHERTAYLQNERIDQLTRNQQLAELRHHDAIDKAAYEGKASQNPIYAKHKEAVEKTLESLRNKGTNTSREELLKWIIGDEALKAKPSKAAVVKKEAAAVRVSAAKGKSTSANSDSGAYTGKGKSAEERLAGVFI